MYSGWIVLNKEIGISSAKATNKLKKILGVKKAGHAGTLDPLATGVLPIAIGEATKTMRYAMNSKKSYEFEVTWGIETNTDDMEGVVISRNSLRPTKDQIKASLKKFIGNINQKPPIFSAIKIKGERAYKLARNKISIDMQSRKVFIEKLILSKYINADKSRFRIICNKGVYIRSLARDLAKYLDTLGHITYLRRLSVGSFSYKDAILLADIEKLVDKSKLLDALKPISFVLDDIPAIDIDKNNAKLLSMGQKVSLNGLAFGKVKCEEEVYVTCKMKIIALARVKNKNILPFRIFNN